MFNHNRVFIILIITIATFLAAGCSVAPLPSEEPTDLGEKTGATFVLKDKTAVEVRETEEVTTYCLQDGSVILVIDRPVLLEEAPDSPFYQDPVRPGQDFGFADLSPEVQEAIRTSLESNPPHFDLNKQLERAWVRYKKYSQDQDFRPFRILWRHYPCAESEKVIYIMTEAEGLKDEWSTDNEQTTAAFDKATGERIPPEELFTCSTEELADTMVRLSGLSDETKMKEMIEAFDLSHLVVYPGQTYLWYPEGTLKDQTPAKYWLTFDNAEQIQSLYQPWARPYSY